MKHLISVIIFALACAGPARSDVAASEIQACKTAPTSECLADIGFALAMRDTTHPQMTQAATLLAQMGRIDEAYELFVWSNLVNGFSQDSAQSLADLTLDNFRIIEALLNGQDYKTVFRDRPNYAPIAAFSAMSGMTGTGADIEVSVTTDSRRIDLMKEHLYRDPKPEIDPITAASLLNYVGESAAAKEILMSERALSADPTTLPDAIIRLIGIERTQEIYRSMGPLTRHMHASLARNTENPEEVLLALQRELEILEETGSEDLFYFLGLSSLARRAADLDHKDISEKALDKLRHHIENEKEPRLPAQVSLVKALVYVEAPVSEVRDLLNDINRTLPTTERPDDLAEELARYYANIGDAKMAAKLMERDAIEFHDWDFLIKSNLDLGTIELLLKFAGKQMTEEQFSYVKAQAALVLADRERSREDHARGLEMAWDLIDAPLLWKDHWPGYTFVQILKVANRLRDDALERAALERFTQAALDKKQSHAIIQAAHFHFEIVNRLAE